MEGLKPPYIMLSNHMHFIDFELTATALYPHRMNNVVNIDGFYKRAWLLRWIGAIATRKFTTDLHLIKSMIKCLSRNNEYAKFVSKELTELNKPKLTLTQNISNEKVTLIYESASGLFSHEVEI